MLISLRTADSSHSLCAFTPLNSMLYELSGDIKKSYVSIQVTQLGHISTFLIRYQHWLVSADFTCLLQSPFMMSYFIISTDMHGEVYFK